MPRPFCLQTRKLVISDDRDRDDPSRGDRRGLRGPNGLHAPPSRADSGRSADGSNKLPHTADAAKPLVPTHTAHRELPSNHRPRRNLLLEMAALPHNESVVAARRCKPGSGRMPGLLTPMLRGHCITILLSIGSPFLTTVNFDAGEWLRQKDAFSETLHMVPKATIKGKRSFAWIGAYC